VALFAPIILGPLIALALNDHIKAFALSGIVSELGSLANAVPMSPSSMQVSATLPTACSLCQNRRASSSFPVRCVLLMTRVRTKLS
jgi:hypothetical protein